MKELEGKTAVITGASKGIGKAIAELFAQNGAEISLCSASENSAATAADEISKKHGVKCFGAKVDVSKSAQCNDFVEKTIENFGKIDILINNAGITKDNLLVRLKDKDWEQVIDINLKGAFFMCRAAVKYMMKKRYGKIVNISSVSGMSGNPAQANYSASKAGMLGLTKSMARELASRNIRVNALAPGFVETDMTSVLGTETIEGIKKLIPLGYLAKPAEIAQAALFLACPKSDYITGQVLPVNGGLYI